MLTKQEQFKKGTDSQIGDWKAQARPIVGIDEAGRGCLAGPVFAGAVILNCYQKFQDSKSLKESKRNKLAHEIKKNHIFSIGTASVEEIDQLNIHQAALLAMKRAVDKLKLSQGHLLIDGTFLIPNSPQFFQSAFIKGDQKINSISAASILAKTERDKLLHILDNRYPEYGFAKHKGYGTKEHKQAIQKYGPCPIHRKTFSGVKEYL